MAAGLKKSSAQLLIVDDEPLIRDALCEFLTAEGFAVTACGTGEEAVKIARGERIDVALADIQLPGMDGLALLGELLKLNPRMFVLLITAYATVGSAIQAFQRGAHDYLMKPMVLDEVLRKIRRLLAYRDLAWENQYLRREMNRIHDPAQIVGKSIAMQAILALVDRVAPTRSSVLLTGESGTGKELIARALHRGGDDDRFLAINCAAIPHDLLENQLFGHRKGAFTGADRDQAGMFVHARGGTIFLDEIAELPTSTQAKLLRAIDQREVLPIGANEPIAVDARVLAATNKNLEEEVKAGRFREDLFYRLNVISIRMPPLRDRREDIPDLVDFLVAKHAALLSKPVHGVTYEALGILMACRWKGNVRELENVLQRAIILGDGPLITPADLPADLVPEMNDYALVDDLAEAIRRYERQHIERMLRRFPDKKEAARRLGVGLSSLYRKISELGIAVPAETEPATVPQPGAV